MGCADFSRSTLQRRLPLLITSLPSLRMRRALRPLCAPTSLCSISFSMKTIPSSLVGAAEFFRLLPTTREEPRVMEKVQQPATLSLCHATNYFFFSFFVSFSPLCTARFLNSMFRTELYYDKKCYILFRKNVKAYSMNIEAERIKASGV